MQQDTGYKIVRDLYCLYLVTEAIDKRLVGDVKTYEASYEWLEVWFDRYIDGLGYEEFTVRFRLTERLGAERNQVRFKQHGFMTKLLVNLDEFEIDCVAAPTSNDEYTNPIDMEDDEAGIDIVHAIVDCLRELDMNWEWDGEAWLPVYRGMKTNE